MAVDGPATIGACEAGDDIGDEHDVANGADAELDSDSAEPNELASDELSVSVAAGVGGGTSISVRCA